MQRSILKLALGLSLVALAVPANAADFSETKTFSSKTLTLTNLIGEVRVSGHRGSDFEVVVQVHGADASRDAVQLETTGDSLTVVFPKSKNYVYPALGGHHEVRFSPNDDDSWLGALFGRSQVRVSNRGSGLEVWADIEVRVPADGNLRLRQGVGAVTATEVAGYLDLDSHYGQVTVDGVEGDLVVDTGSGDVSVTSTNGDLSIDTGSGDVDVNGARSHDVVVDTGSGDVTLNDVASSGDISVDTGSGDVTLSDVSGSDVNIDTGSGDVDASAVRAENALIDTGSGSVVLSLVEMGQGNFDIDTGSGGIRLVLPADASCRVQAETGSGGIDVAVDGTTNMRRNDDDDEVSFTIGGGEANVRLDTGSGKIRIVDAR